MKKDWLQLLTLKMYTEIYDFKEYLKDFKYYFQSFKFFLTDQFLILSYFFQSPFRITQKYFEVKNVQDFDPYGETPFSTLEKIATKAEITSNDIFYELGCGRGRPCFWINQFIGCKVIGVEQIPQFIETASWIKDSFKFQNLSFRREDFFKADLSDATAIYLYGTCLTEKQIYQLIENFNQLKPGTKIITISYPLTDYITDQYEVMKCFKVSFNWGDTDAYYQIKL